MRSSGRVRNSTTGCKPKHRNVDARRALIRRRTRHSPASFPPFGNAEHRAPNRRHRNRAAPSTSTVGSLRTRPSARVEAIPSGYRKHA